MYLFFFLVDSGVMITDKICIIIIIINFFEVLVAHRLFLGPCLILLLNSF